MVGGKKMGRAAWVGLAVCLAWSVGFCQEKGGDAAKSYDDVYVTTAGNKENIPHPLSKKGKMKRVKGKEILVPEGMVLVPAGEFIMGEGNSEHKVYLDAFCIGKFEVTNAEWKAFIDATGFRPFPQHWRAGAPPEGKENHPVVYVSWEDAQKYCEWVSEGTGWEVRLPTEAEWEKAASWDAKKRRKMKYPWGNEWNMKQCNKLCNSGYNLAKFGFRPPNDSVFYDMLSKFQKTHKELWDKIVASGGNTTPVGSYRRVRTRYGLYDTAGNVWEWCLDWYKEEYYLLKDACKNPMGPSEMEADEVEISGRRVKARLLRGGAWRSDSYHCRAARRNRGNPSGRSSAYGFRVVLSRRP
jgi:iron(II)-dependent oxidoreductase